MYTEKDVRFENVKYGKNMGAMKDLLKKPMVAEMLDRWDEQREFYSLLRSRAKGGITRKEMRQILGHLRRGGGKTIDRTEAMKIAHAIFPGRFTERYDFPDESASGNDTLSLGSPSSGISSAGMGSVASSPSGYPSRHASVGRRASRITASSAVAPTAEYRRRPGQRPQVPQVPLASQRLSRPLPISFPTHFGAFRMKAVAVVLFALLVTVIGVWWFAT